MKVFIMGMHRSGTSLVTGLLKRCGLHVGTKLLMHARDNPKGHYEEKRFLDLNNKILRRNGGDWEHPPTSIAYYGLESLMIQFLKRDEWKREFVGWKDPRICLTFPLWRELVYPEKIKIIYVVRPLEEIAMSLVKRNGFSYRKALELGRIYSRHAHANLHRKGVSSFVTYFKHYFSPRWKLEVEAACRFIGLEPPTKLKPLERFISPELRHFKGVS